MRRWNGWGDSGVEYPLPQKGPAFLEDRIGAPRSQKDIKLETVIAAVPRSRLEPHPLISSDPVKRLCHARGQSLPDWIALRSGHVDTFPDGVAHPASNDDVAELIKYAKRTHTKLIPYGGGTSVVGHINPPASDTPVLTVNMRHMNQLYRFDETSLLATFGAGISGPALEARLRALGYTLGHLPQSFELSTLGGWIATRSSGQQSLGYGRIEDLFAGGKVITKEAVIEGDVFGMTGRGWYDIDKTLDFKIQIRLLKGKTFVGKAMHKILAPLSWLLECRLTGTLDEPEWYIRNFSKDLLKKLGLSDTDGTGK